MVSSDYGAHWLSVARQAHGVIRPNQASSSPSFTAEQPLMTRDRRPLDPEKKVDARDDDRSYHGAIFQLKLA